MVYTVDWECSPEMGIVAIITVVTQHINMTFRDILQDEEKVKLGWETNKNNRWED